MGAKSLLHVPSGPASVVVKLHPAVLFHICDSYIRRNDQQDRVIGTLLGSVSPDGSSIDVRNSYAVPHNESSDQVAVDIDYHRSMYELYQRVNPKEVIIGWYSTSASVTGSDALIQDFYAREVNNPIHLTVDTLFRDETASIKAFVSTNLSLGERSLAAHFQEVQLDLRLLDAERVGFDMLKNTVVNKLPNDLEGLEDSMQRLYSMIDMVFKYVDDVVEGAAPADKSIGRYLADTLSMIPKMAPDDFSKLFNNSMQDLLLVVYLSHMTRAQLSLAEKLNTAAQII